MRITNLRVTHKSASLPILEALTIRNQNRFFRKVMRADLVREFVIVQTCNRVEMYFSHEADPANVSSWIQEIWAKTVGLPKKKLMRVVESDVDSEAIRHLLRLCAGLESMLIGEDQILGQVRTAYENSKDLGMVGPHLGLVLEKAIKVGGEVRTETGISKGAVSVGGAAVNLVQRILGDMKDSKVLVIGAGDIGRLTCKALSSRKKARVLIANRTYQKAVKVARMVGAHPIPFREIKKFLVDVDAAIVTTSAPDYVLKKADVERALARRKSKRLLIIDIAQPRNVDQEIAKLPGLTLCNIDHLRGIAELNIKSRRREIRKAENIIKQRLEALDSLLKRKSVEPVVSAIYGKAEETRRREFTKAVHLLKDINEEQKKIIEDMSRVLVERTLYQPVSTLRKAAEMGEGDTITLAQKLFDVKAAEEETRSVSND